MGNDNGESRANTVTKGKRYPARRRYPTKNDLPQAVQAAYLLNALVADAIDLMLQAWRDLYIPACCSPSAMPEGTARNAIAAQAGGAFCAGGGLVAAVALAAATPRARTIPIAILLLIIPSSSRRTIAYSAATTSTVGLTTWPRSGSPR